jgi:uncharacterized OB-fold protein
MSDKKIVSINSVMTMQCQWSVGKTVDKFLESLSGGKITGVKCSGCGMVYVPPQQVCGDCFKVMEEWVELSGEGEVANYTVAHVDVRNKPLDETKVIGMIKLDGADTTLFGEIKDADAGSGLIGKKVKAVFRDKLKGSIRDISHYEPV